MAATKDPNQLVRAIDRILRELDDALRAYSDDATERLRANYALTGKPSLPNAEDWPRQIRALAARRPALAKVFGLRRG
jgi:hypothetical protein